MRENKVEIRRPNLPLDPIVGEADSEYPEIKAAHDALLAEIPPNRERPSNAGAERGSQMNKDNFAPL